MRRLFIVLFVLLQVFMIQSCSKERRSDRAGEKMQEFVINLSNWAHGRKSDFIIIPQNGSELAFNYLWPEDGLNEAYLNAVDGFGIEELFWFYSYSPDEERLNMLRTLIQYKPVLVSEMVQHKNDIPLAYAKNINEGFLCFVRDSSNYYYEHIPDTIIAENSNDIITMQDAKNYLYLIGSDAYADKNAFLNAIAATSFDVVLIDLFFGEQMLTSSDLSAIRQKACGGKRLIIAYISIGSAERYRYYWQENWKLHHPNFIRKAYDGYPDEFWVRFWDKDWQEIIYGSDDSYLGKIINAGFDGAYLDNTEAYYYLYQE